MTAKCAAARDPDSAWSFCPSIAAAYLFTLLFLFTTGAHLAQAIIHRKGYSWVIIVSGALQTTNYILRILSIKNPTSGGYYIGSFVLILIAPLWTNAYVYMVVGRMVYNFTASARIAKIKAWRFGLYFVLLDIFAFLVQLFGAASAAGKNVSRSRALRGLHIYMFGIGVQEAFVLMFFVITIKFHKQLLKAPPVQRQRQVFQLLYIVYAVLVAITIRIIFRLIEFSSGFDSSIPNHEAYQYCLDSLPMLIASVLLNVVHPGRVMPGKAGDFPSRKERKTFDPGNRGSAAELVPTSYQQLDPKAAVPKHDPSQVTYGRTG